MFSSHRFSKFANCSISLFAPSPSRQSIINLSDRNFVDMLMPENFKSDNKRVDLTANDRRMFYELTKSMSSSHDFRKIENCNTLLFGYQIIYN